MKPAIPIDPPVGITESLDRFRREYPDAGKVAFIMLKYEDTNAHARILGAVYDALKAHGITGVLAKDKDYHDQLHENVLTYLYGCGLGVAIFDRILKDDFSANVSFEVGYMLALRKPICYLKDRTLTALHTDILSKLYKSFDSHDPEGTIPKEITRWLTDNSLIPR